MELTIADWTPEHPHWGDLRALVAALGQTRWVDFSADFHQSSHLLVATRGEEIAGFLRFVAQAIGPDMDCPPVRLGDNMLTEAKILAFGVAPAQRRQGIGQALQIAAIEQARRLGCWQVRSHSGGDSAANHQLKLALGFGVQPVVRGEDTRGVYFILPLRTAIDRVEGGA